ncbi:hypothetical protein BJ165DRAFT_1527057 [Panaeolus papilionaceus]|nr:hypothetical protein BJ165DRAFT_1527057 [Panaeolus papilionaceus]
MFSVSKLIGRKTRTTKRAATTGSDTPTSRLSALPDLDKPKPLAEPAASSLLLSTTPAPIVLPTTETPPESTRASIALEKESPTIPASTTPAVVARQAATPDPVVVSSKPSQEALSESSVKVPGPDSEWAVLDPIRADTPKVKEAEAQANSLEEKRQAERIASLETEVKGLNEKVQLEEKQHAEKITSLEGEIKGMSEQIRVREEENKVLRTQSEEHRKAFEAARSQAEEEARRSAEQQKQQAARFEEKEREAQRSSSNFTSQIKTLTAEKQQLSQRLTSLESELETIRGDAKSKVAVITDLRQNTQRRDAEVKQLKEQTSQLRASLEEERSKKKEETTQSERAFAAEKSRLEERVAQFEKEKEGLEMEIAVQREQLAMMETKILGTGEESGQHRLENQELKDVIAQQDQEINSMRAQLTERMEQIGSLETNEDNLINRFIQLQGKIDAVERQNRVMLDQVRQQSDELIVRSSGDGNGQISKMIIDIRHGPVGGRVEQAVRVIKVLNDEIYQTAACLADSVVNLEKRFVRPAPSDNALSMVVEESLKSVLGTELLKALVDEAPLTGAEYNNFFIQTAFQGCLTACCWRIITSWYPMEWEYGDFLAALYERIRGTSGVSKAMQWRRLTQQSCVSSSNSVLSSRLLTYIIQPLEEVMGLSGWAKTVESEQMMQNFHKKLSELVALALQVNNLAATGVVGGRLDPTLVKAGNILDPRLMVDDNTNESDDCASVFSYEAFSRDSEVVCTLALGMRWVEDYTQKEQVFLKPRVLLRSALDG